MPSLLVGMDSRAVDLGKRVVLWGASVGPFDREPTMIEPMKRHLERMALITVRESKSLDLLRSWGLTNVLRVSDPAFILEASPAAIDQWPASNDGVLGVNISSLVTRRSTGGASRLLDEIEWFLRQVLDGTTMGVALVPHVVPRSMSGAGDQAIQTAILSRMTDYEGRICAVPASLNAAEMKDVISRCRFFIGARTHATIAALSSLVPTISLGYSIKAVGLNEDVFGHSRWLTDGLNLGGEELLRVFGELREQEDSVRSLLARRIPTLQGQARVGARHLCDMAAQTP